ncbi:hypothetical protein TGME49_273640 [Toxoplasma gondii ME49]|uniref:Uncharacterized protein n=3 Tax=Toxoplasma gondii TaxID=5811 RepID=A0A0F7UYN1_TOXGV|nr:hypothetical protein TGME49_273640 [Toxoplasma gondii ME49]EPT28673.1 hypothetical protein TGME49_273640 [Toxoplasma gondii ME49]ESS36016.1 hypothetical protein TGVEG_273640 [Toxoplasma gondii VEG]KYF46426.1 hypothetical protein TGARI_273640 [Toxoplasma gondii ARI]CEL75096.1 TPA: hypothetical protein BN1205_020880 [Toxoplasma gondii VEG]|eukprot:XP_018636732.1 hypothetical protein TGME49_273640 [Toxoplasma gondii ME49]
MEARERVEDDVLSQQVRPEPEKGLPEIVVCAKTVGMTSSEKVSKPGQGLHQKSRAVSKPKGRVATGRFPVLLKREETPIRATSGHHPKEQGTDASGDESAWSDASSDVEPLTLTSPVRDLKRREFDVKLNVLRSLVKARGSGSLVHRPGVEEGSETDESGCCRIPPQGQLGLEPTVCTPQAAGQARESSAACCESLRSAFLGKKAQRGAMRTAENRRGTRRGVQVMKKKALLAKLCLDNDSGENVQQRRIKESRDRMFGAGRASVDKNRRGRRRVPGGVEGFLGTDNESMWMSTAYLKDRAGDYADDLLDNLGLLATNDFLDRELDRDTLLLDYDDSLFDDDDDLLFPDDPSNSRYFLPDGYPPSPGRRNEERVIDISSPREDKSLSELEKETDDATTWTIMRQMVGSLGVRHWAAFLQVQAEFWLYSSAHRQALITATAAQRFLREAGGTKTGETQEKNGSAKDVTATATACKRREQESAAASVDSRADLTPTLAVKMVAACALRQFDRSNEYLRQLRGRDLNALSEPLQAYLEEAVRFLAENTTPTLPSVQLVPRV